MAELQMSINLNDLMSGKIDAIMSKVDQLERKLTNMRANLNINTSGLNATAAANFGQTAGRSLNSSAVMWGNMASSILLNAGRIIMKNLEDVMKAGEKQALARADINALLREKGPEIFKEAQDYAVHSMYGVGVYKNVQQLAGFGIPADKIMSVMKAIGEFSGGNEYKTSLLSKDVGELFAGDLNKRHLTTLAAQGGVTPKMLATEFGMKSAEEFQKAWKKRQISGEQLVDALIRLSNNPDSIFYHRQEKVMDSNVGRGVQLRTNWELLKANIGEGIIASEGFKKFLGSITGLQNTGDNLVPQLIQLGSELFKSLSYWTDILHQFVGSHDMVALSHTVVSGLELLAAGFAVSKIMTIVNGLGMLGNVFGVGKSISGTAVGGFASMAGGAMAGVGGSAIAALPYVLIASIVAYIGYTFFNGFKQNQLIDKENAVKYPNYTKLTSENGNNGFLGMSPNAKMEEFSKEITKNGYLYDKEMTEVLAQSYLTGGIDAVKAKELSLKNEVMDQFQEIDSMWYGHMLAFKQKPETILGPYNPDQHKKSNKGNKGNSNNELEAEEGKVVGNKTTTINITMKNMVNIEEQNVGGGQEAASDIEDALIRAISDAINTAEGIHGRNN